MVHYVKSASAELKIDDVARMATVALMNLEHVMIRHVTGEALYTAITTDYTNGLLTESTEADFLQKKAAVLNAINNL